MKNIVTTILMLAVSASIAYSQDGGERSRGYGFLMLEEPSSPRNIAMGSVGTALGGSGFRYYNPVQPFFTASPFVAAEFGQMPGGVNRGGFETALVFREWFSAVSFHTSSVGYQTSDERGVGPPAQSAATTGAAGAGYVRDNLAAGVSLAMAEDRIWREGRYAALALSAGLGYRMFDGKLSLGAAGFHVAAWSRGFGEGESASEWRSGRVPRFARAGAAWADTLKSFPYTVAADAAYRDEDGTLTVPVGVSVRALPVLDLRIGKRIGWDSEILSLGFGLNVDKISFDAAFVPSVLVGDYEIKWSMALSYSLGGWGREKKKPLVMPPVRIKPESEPEPEPEPAPDEPEQPVQESAEPEPEPESVEPDGAAGGVDAGTEGAETDGGAAGTEETGAEGAGAGQQPENGGGAGAKAGEAEPESGAGE